MATVSSDASSAAFSGVLEEDVDTALDPAQELRALQQQLQRAHANAQRLLNTLALHCDMLTSRATLSVTRCVELCEDTLATLFTHARAIRHEAQVVCSAQEKAQEHADELYEATSKQLRAMSHCLPNEVMLGALLEACETRTCLTALVALRADELTTCEVPGHVVSCEIACMRVRDGRVANSKNDQETVTYAPVHVPADAAPLNFFDFAAQPSALTLAIDLFDSRGLPADWDMPASTLTLQVLDGLENNAPDMCACKTGHLAPVAERLRYFAHNGTLYVCVREGNCPWTDILHFDLAYSSLPGSGFVNSQVHVEFCVRVVLPQFCDRVTKLAKLFREKCMFYAAEK